MTTSYRFGTQRLDNRRALFRLWAPSAARVELFVETFGRTREFAMQRQDDSWYSCMVEVDVRHYCLYWFRIDNDLPVPDPASRHQPRDVHGPSLLVAPAKQMPTTASGWQGRPWQEAVIYELHIGTFTPQGTLAAAAAKLDYLAELGITAVELMPLADFPGRRNWGYDGVLPFAPDSSYGSIADLHRFIDAAHARKLMVFLDVVYNHFGPEGNYLYVYAKPFFTDRHTTPWGKAIDFEGRRAATVRRFFIENALFWLEEFGFDGLRLDAVHAIYDDSEPHILRELAEAIRDGPGRHRQIHLMLENDNNASHYLRWQTSPGKTCYTAQWNDDIHHAFHCLLTGEDTGYYSDFSERAIDYLGRCLTSGFAWQGEISPFRGNRPRGEPSGDLAPTRFISFLQNHDQIGNRALGERLSCICRPEALRAATAALLLGPSIPLLFMGQEWAASTPFLFFCDFEPELAARVTQGRRKEFAGLAQFRSPRLREQIPDPNREDAYYRSILKWQEAEVADHDQWLSFHRRLLHLRQRKIVPLLAQIPAGNSSYRRLGRRALQAEWPLSDGSRLVLLLNLGDRPVTPVRPPIGEVIEETGERAPADDMLPPFFCGWYLLPGKSGNGRKEQIEG